MRLALLLLMIVNGVVGERAAAQEPKAMQWSGDLRLRLERIDAGDFPGLPASDPIIRERLRARIGLDRSLSQTLKVGVRLATGSATATSNNQNLGDEFNRKAFLLDTAFVQYLPHTGVDLIAGKMKNPFLTPGKSDLVMDQDITPEGIYAGYTGFFGPLTVSPRFGNFVLQERNNNPDIELNVGQLGIGYQSATVVVVVGGGVYNFANIKGSDVLPNGARGNSASSVTTSSGTVISTTYQYGYFLNNAFLELTFSALDMPHVFYIDYIENTDAPDHNTGYLAGLRLGDATKPGIVEVGIAHKLVEKDATVGAMAESDMAGGGASVRGNKYSVAYGLTESAFVQATHFDADEILVTTAGKSYLGFDTTQLDINVKF